MELLDVMFAEYELFHTVKVEVHKLINFVMQKIRRKITRSNVRAILKENLKIQVLLNEIF